MGMPRGKKTNCLRCSPARTTSMAGPGLAGLHEGTTGSDRDRYLHRRPHHLHHRKIPSSR